MKNYYYLVASLPSNNFNDGPRLGKNMFLQECAKWLSARDMETLRAADISYSKKNENDAEIISTWKTFDEELRTLLMAERFGRKRGGQHQSARALSEALREGTPLEKEIKYEKIRWDFLEEQGKQHFFDIDRLVIYFLKLQILERLSKFNKDEGEKVFYNLCEVNYEKTIG